MRTRAVLLLSADDETGLVTAACKDARSGADLVTVQAPSQAEGVDASADALECVRALVEEMHPDVPRTVDVRLAAPVVQIRTLAGLPPVGRRDLQRLVSEQKEKFFRTPTGEPVVVARWKALSDEGRLAFAAMADLTTLEEIERLFLEADSRVERFEVSRDAESSGALALPTQRTTARRRRRTARTVVAAVAVAIVGWLVPAIAYVSDLSADDRVLDAQLAEAEEALERLDSLDQRVAEFEPIAAAFRRQASGSGWATRALAETLSDLPEGLHLHSLRMNRSGEVDLVAHSDEASGFAESVESRWGREVEIVGDAATPNEFTIVLSGAS